MTAAWGDAATMLSEVGVAEDTSYYRQFTGADEKAALTIGMRISAAWAANDADAFAENGSLLLQDEQLTSRAEIRAYMAAGFAGPLRGARVHGWPVAVQFLNDDAAFLVTQGGIIMPGDDRVLPQREIRAVWVIAR